MIFFLDALYSQVYRFFSNRNGNILVIPYTQTDTFKASGLQNTMGSDRQRTKAVNLSINQFGNSLDDSIRLCAKYFLKNFSNESANIQQSIGDTQKNCFMFDYKSRR